MMLQHVCSAELLVTPVDGDDGICRSCLSWDGSAHTPAGTNQERKMGKRKTPRVISALAMIAATLAMSQTASLAVPSAPGVVFDDFEDNDTSDWACFGGNAAGGGGGPASDRPQDGSGYFSTGWGGDGTASGFYGGAFKNLPEASQVVLPADPWFNIWVYQQSEPLWLSMTWSFATV
jgi:hypothetical protein